MSIHPLVLALHVLSVVICAVALWKGDRAERVATLIIIGNIALTILLDLLLSGGMRGMMGLVVDAATAFGLLALTLKYGFPWLGAAMLLYAAQFGLHAYYLITERPPTDVFHATINNLNFLGVLLCLALGVASAVARRRARPAAG